MEQVSVSRLLPGMTLELTGRQKLWDVTKRPWRELSPPSRLVVLKVSRLSTGARGDRVPYEVILSAPDGARVVLEVADGEELVAITTP